MKNVKIFFVAILIFMLSVLSVFAVSGDVNKDYIYIYEKQYDFLIVDMADLLSDAAKKNLLERAKTVSDKYNMDVAVVTVKSLNGRNVENVIEAFYEEYDYGRGLDKDGIMLLICPEERDYALRKSGKVHYALDGRGYWENYIIDEVKSHLKYDDYELGFMAYLDKTDEVFSKLKPDGTLPKPPTNPILYVVSVAISFFIALLSAQVGKSTLRTVRYKHAANSYKKEGSMKIRDKSDKFLYRNVSVKAKPKPKSSGSGRVGGASTSSGKY